MSHARGGEAPFNYLEPLQEHGGEAQMLVEETLLLLPHQQIHELVVLLLGEVGEDIGKRFY